MKLAVEQVEQIRGVLDKSNISIDTLRDDLLDHLCCVVEINMTKGENFERALKKGIDELAPEGLEEIQHQTLFLLNSSKIIIMKKVMYSIGLLSAMSFVLGWLFGILHKPGAYQLSIYGFLIFVFVFVPLLAIDRYKTNIRWVLSEKLKFSLGLVSGLIVATSILFKIMHLPGAEGLMILGTGLFVFGFLPFLFFTMYKKSVS